MPLRNWWQEVRYVLERLFEPFELPDRPACEPDHHVPVLGNPSRCIKCGRTLW